jgi:hypothetical protein
VARHPLRARQLPAISSARTLLDRNDVELPATSRSFWFQGSAWEPPDFENAESFVARLVGAGLLVRDPP